jgi:hypothetical protein
MKGGGYKQPARGLYMFFCIGESAEEISLITAILVHLRRRRQAPPFKIQG